MIAVKCVFDSAIDAIFSLVVAYTNLENTASIVLI